MLQRKLEEKKPDVSDIQKALDGLRITYAYSIPDTQRQRVVTAYLCDRDIVWREELEKAAKISYSSENTDFISAVQTLIKKAKPNNCQAELEQLVKTFIIVKAPQQINIEDGAIYSKIINDYQTLLSKGNNALNLNSFAGSLIAAVTQIISLIQLGGVSDAFLAGEAGCNLVQKEKNGYLAVEVKFSDLKKEMDSLKFSINNNRDLSFSEQINKIIESLNEKINSIDRDGFSLPPDLQMKELKGMMKQIKDARLTLHGGAKRLSCLGFLTGSSRSSVSTPASSRASVTNISIPDISMPGTATPAGKSSPSGSTSDTGSSTPTSSPESSVKKPTTP